MRHTSEQGLRPSRPEPQVRRRPFIVNLTLIVCAAADVVLIFENLTR